MITFNENLIGSYDVVQNGNKFHIEIRQGNCLAVMIYDKGDSYMLYAFIADEQHAKNIQKNYAILLGAENVRLNMRYKECAKLLKYFVKEKDITCYYE